VIETPSKPRTKYSAKRMHGVHTTQETSETLENFIPPILCDDKDTSIIKLQE
jgi:hypothetical protein